MAASRTRVARTLKSVDDFVVKAPRKVDLGEIGSSGLKRWSGSVDEEFLVELRGTRGMKVFREMRDNSAIIGALLFAIKWLARATPFTVQPGAETNDAKARAEFIRGALFDDMSFTFQDLLSDILTMLPFGWAWFEVVYKVRHGEQPIPDPPVPNAPASSRFSDGRIGWRKWALRAQDTLDKWEFDPAGGIHGMWQMPHDRAVRVFLPIQKSLLFRTDVEKNNPEGRSILRTAYRPWYYVKHIENIEAIGIERELAGYPVIKVLPDKDAPDIWNANDPSAVDLLAQMKELARSIKRDEQEGAVLPDWCELTLLSGGGRRAIDTSAVIERYSRQMLMTVLADFIMIGHEQVGSKALFGGKSGLFALAMTGFLDVICGVINRYAITTLLRLNGLPLAEPPVLKAGTVKDVDLVALADYLAKLSGAGAVMFPNAALEQHLLELADLPATLPEGGVEPTDERDDDEPPAPPADDDADEDGE